MTLFSPSLPLSHSLRFSLPTTSPRPHMQISARAGHANERMREEKKSPRRRCRR